MEQLLAHLVGDYMLQNSWMAANKGKSIVAATIHGVFYTLPFLLLTSNPVALLLIATTHIAIDYFKLGHIYMWAKDQFAPKKYRSSLATFLKTFPQKPEWLHFWLRIIIDNTMHLVINYFVLKHIG